MNNINKPKANQLNRFDNRRSTQTISLHLPPHGFRICNSKACLFQVEMTGRTELDKAGEQFAVVFFGLSDAVMDDGCVAAHAAEIWQCGGICQQSSANEPAIASTFPAPIVRTRQSGVAGWRGRLRALRGRSSRAKKMSPGLASFLSGYVASSEAGARIGN